MAPEDQAHFSVVVDTVHALRVDEPESSREIDKLERDEQRVFASWLLLQNSKRGPKEKFPFVWHATHTRSKASPGTPDFFVGLNGHAIWIEFKVGSNKLTPEQEEFRLACVCQGIEWLNRSKNWRNSISVSASLSFTASRSRANPGSTGSDAPAQEIVLTRQGVSYRLMSPRIFNRSASSVSVRTIRRPAAWRFRALI